MAWLRLDDGFTKHPKFEGWTPAQRWAWLEVMEYCARYRTGGRIPTDDTILPRSTSRTILAKAESSGWCARGDDGALWINDWNDFNPPRGEEVDEAVKAAVDADPEASANDLYRRIGGNRNAVLKAITRYRSGIGAVSGTGITEVVPIPVSRAHPVPSSTTEEEPPAAAAEPALRQPDAAAADTIERLQALGIDPTTVTNLDHAAAWLDVAEHEAQRNPAGFVITGLATGQPPSPRSEPPAAEPSLLDKARGLYDRTHDREAVDDWLAGITRLTPTDRERILTEATT
jgi:hypothetical protein